MIVTLSPRATLTVPSEVRKSLDLQPGDALEMIVSEGGIRLTPVVMVPRSLALSSKGRGKEAVAVAEIAEGKTRTFETAEQLIEDLNEDRAN